MRLIYFCCITIFIFTSWTTADNHGKVGNFSYNYTTQPFWTKDSHYKDSYYHGTIIARVSLSANNGGGLNQIHTYLKDWFTERVNTNHGSHPATWQKVDNYFEYVDFADGEKTKHLDAWSLPIVAEDQDAKGKIRMKLMAYLAYQKDERVILYTKVEEILSSEGKKKRLKDFDNYFHYTKAKEQGYYNIFLKRSYKVEGYWYEPTGVFVDSVKKQTMETFFDYFKIRFPDWAKNL